MSHKPLRHISLVMGMVLAAVVMMLLSHTEPAHAQQAPQSGPPLRSLTIEEADGTIWKLRLNYPYAGENVDLSPSEHYQFCSTSSLLRISYYISSGKSSIRLDGTEVKPEESHPGATRVETVSLPATSERLLVVRTTSDTNISHYSDYTIRICSDTDAPRVTSLRLQGAKSNDNIINLLDWTYGATTFGTPSDPHRFELCYPDSSDLVLSYRLNKAANMSIRGPTQEVIYDKDNGLVVFRLDRSRTNHRVILLTSNDGMSEEYVGGLSNQYVIDICTDPLSDIELTGHSEGSHELTSLVSMTLGLSPAFSPGVYLYEASNANPSGVPNVAVHNVSIDFTIGPPLTSLLLHWRDASGTKQTTYRLGSTGWDLLPWTTSSSPSTLTVEATHPVLVDGTRIGETAETYVFYLTRYASEEIVTINPDPVDLQNNKCPSPAPEVSWSNLGDWDDHGNHVADGRAVPFDTSGIGSCPLWGPQEAITLGNPGLRIGDYGRSPLFNSEGWKFFVGDDDTAYRGTQLTTVIGRVGYQYITDRGFLLTIYGAGTPQAPEIEGRIEDYTGRVITWFSWNVNLHNTTLHIHNSSRFGAVIGYPWVGVAPVDYEITCHLPLEMFDHCNNPVDLLPLWRWSRVSNLWTDWGGNFFTSHIRAAIGGGFDLIVQLLFVIAGFAWDILAHLVYLALAADFTTDILNMVDRTFYGVSTGIVESGLVYLVAVIGFGVAAWKLYKDGPQEAIRSIAWTMLPLGLLMFMMISVTRAWPSGPSRDQLLSDGGLQLERAEDYASTYVDKKYVGTPGWMHEKVRGLSTLLSDGLTQFSLSLTDHRTEHVSYCTVYSHQLERLYLQTIYDQHDYRNDGNRNQNAELKASDYSPIAISRLWERAYMAGWGMAQFGSPEAALNGSCLWAEHSAAEVTPSETMAVWSANCYPDHQDGLTPSITNDNGYGTHKYLGGCPQSHDTDQFPIPQLLHRTSYSNRDLARSWRTFDPDNVSERRSMLAIISACNFIPFYALPERSVDAAPEVYPRGSSVSVPITLQATPGDAGSLIVVADNGTHLSSDYLGISNLENDDHYEVSTALTVDTCQAWLTGTQVQSPALRTQGIVGVDGSGIIRGLDSDFVKRHSSLQCADAETSAEYISEQVLIDGGSGTSGSISQFTNAEKINRAADNICTYSGGQYFHRLLHGLIVMLTAFAYMFALVGLAAGTALAQILLGLIFMLLPLILVIAAIPMQQARQLLL